MSKPQAETVDVEQLSRLQTFYMHQSLLDVIFLAAKDLREPVPDIPKMPDEARGFFGGQLGRLTLSTWAVATADTKIALDSYRALSFGVVDGSALETAIEAQDIVLETLRERVCHVAGISIPSSQ